MTVTGERPGPDGRVRGSVDGRLEVGPADVEDAARRIDGRVRTTPVLALDGRDDGVVLKLELLQHTGSFKPRGAFNWLLSRRSSDAVPEAGVVAASGGNFGLAMAYVARELDVPATIVIPEVSPAAKRQGLARLGANVEVVPGMYPDALARSHELVAETGALLAHAYDHVDIVAGQGTCGRELEDQVDGRVDTVLVACGGGGLIGGIAAWFAGRVKVVGVEPARIPALHDALAAGHPVEVEVSGYAADSLGASSVGNVPFAVARRYVDSVALVADEDIEAAQRDLWARCHVAAEPGGAAAWAALASGAYEAEPGERVAVVVCGANFDPAMLTR
jgi:threonine dehydratase